MTPCIETNYWKDKDGYGKCKSNQQTWFTHRFAYIMTYGPPPPSTPLILHKCGNRACWNPEHLYAGTVSDNVNDMIKDGTYIQPNSPKIKCPKCGGKDLYYLKSKQWHRCRPCHNKTSHKTRKTENNP